MIKKEPTSKIPQAKGYATPEVKAVVRPITHYKVNEKIFLNKAKARKEAKASSSEVIESYGPIEVFEVIDEIFVTVEEAEKKCKLLIRKHRDSVRNVARIFGIDRASLAEKNTHLKWLLENYPLQEITDFYDPEDIISKYDFVRPAHIDFFKKFPELDLRIIQRDRKWSWLQNRNIDDYFGIPEEYQEVGPLRTAWVYGEIELRNKIDLINPLISLRTLELACLVSKDSAVLDSNGAVVEVLPLEEVNKLIDFNLIVAEVKNLFKTLDTTELGADLLIELKSGVVIYSVADRKKDLNPFKRF
jgi:hypothetical protein